MSPPSASVRITVAGDLVFGARFEDELAPLTCGAFRDRLPFVDSILQARWSGRAAWIPLGDFDFGIGHENPTSVPLPGEILIYPGGISETEILFPYGATVFSSVAGRLAGNHFLTIVAGAERLPELGELVLRKGAQDIRFEAV